MCVRACACMCMCLHACGDTPHSPDAPRHPPTHLPLPQSRREPKTPKFNKSWTNQDISIVWRFFTCEYSWTHIDYSCLPWISPTHLPHLLRTEETQIGRITITFEQNEIIEFCLKIWDPWMLLHTYRLHLMRRLGGCSIPKGTFMQKVVLWPSKKFFFLFLHWIH